MHTKYLDIQSCKLLGRIFFFVQKTTDDQTAMQEMESKMTQLGGEVSTIENLFSGERKQI
jgi:hypothetical protein